MPLSLYLHSSHGRAQFYTNFVMGMWRHGEIEKLAQECSVSQYYCPLLL